MKNIRESLLNEPRSMNTRWMSKNFSDSLLKEPYEFLEKGNIKKYFVFNKPTINVPRWKKPEMNVPRWNMSAMTVPRWNKSVMSFLPRTFLYEIIQWWMFRDEHCQDECPSIKQLTYECSTMNQIVIHVPRWTKPWCRFRDEPNPWYMFHDETNLWCMFLYETNPW